MTIDVYVDDIIDGAMKEVAAMMQEYRRELLYLKVLNRHDHDYYVRSVLGSYYCAFHPHFTTWMAYAAVFAESDVARNIAMDNLRCEIKEDHKGLFEDMVVKVLRVDPDRIQEGSVSMVTPVIKDINNFFVLAFNEHCPGIASVALCTLLENTSLHFIPLLEECVEGGLTTFEYIEKHGEADLLHAEYFRRALKEELCNNPNNPMNCTETAKILTLNLLRAIFNPSRI